MPAPPLHTNLSLSGMADRLLSTGPAPSPARVYLRPPARLTLLRRFHDRVPNSTQLVGLLALVISGVILLLLSGATLIATITGMIFLLPLLILTSPIWIPAGIMFVLMMPALLSVGGIGVAASWLYKYWRGRRPLGSDRVDYARGRIVDTASHLRDYVREYGGYAKDAAPGA